MCPAIRDCLRRYCAPIAGLCAIAGGGEALADCAASVGGGGRLYLAGSDAYRSYDELASITADLDCNYSMGGGHSLNATAFARARQHDSARTHMDVRQLAWMYTSEPMQVRAGIDRVFWGVTEFAHVVDIINQSDVLEDPFGETKLGQPLLSIGLRQRWGNATALVMPRFRDRIFPQPGAPLRPAPPLDLGPAAFESDDRRDHLDWALRYSRTAGSIDLGISYFSGTGRDPLFRAVPPSYAQAQAYYPQIAQVGLDVQLSWEEWLFKLEAASRRTFGRDESAWSVGAERVLAGLIGPAGDLTVVLEYARDRRTPAAIPGFLQDDWAVGLRLALNDVRSTEAKVGVIVDGGYGSRAWALELSSRFQEQWRVAVEARLFSDVSTRDPLSAIRDDGYFDLSLSRYF